MVLKYKKTVLLMSTYGSVIPPSDICFNTDTKERGANTVHMSIPPPATTQS